MQLFYVQHGSGLTHIEAFRNVKIVISNLKSFIDKKETFGIGDIDSDNFGTPLTSNIIGEPIEKGDIWLSGTQVIPISKMLMTILERAKGDLDHQYASYFRETRITDAKHSCSQHRSRTGGRNGVGCQNKSYWSYHDLFGIPYQKHSK